MKSGSKSITVAVRVQPRASRNEMIVQADGSLKVYLTAAPAKGAANAALVEFLAKALRIPRQSLSIVAGKSGRNKLISVSGIDRPTLREKLSAVK